jgi:hypothetical protein
LSGSATGSEIVCLSRKTGRDRRAINVTRLTQRRHCVALAKSNHAAQFTIATRQNSVCASSVPDPKMRFLVLALLLVSATSAFAQSEPAEKDNNTPTVDVELVLAVDVSRSMDKDKLALRREGYAQAIVSKEFALRSRSPRNSGRDGRYPSLGGKEVRAGTVFCSPRRTRQASFAKSAYGSQSTVEIVVRHRFDHVAFDSPDRQILMNVVSCDRPIARKIPYTQNRISLTDSI